MTNENFDYLNELLKEEATARFLNLSVRTLQGLRLKGGGPKYIKLSHRAIRYRRSDLIDWIKSKIRLNTSE